MRKLTFIAILLLHFSTIYCQQQTLVFKKGKQTVSRYWKGSTIAFQLSNKEWRKGEITAIRNDSFYIRPMVVTYHLMGSDTAYYPVSGFSRSDIYAMPKKGILIHFKNGRFEISRSGGHVHWYWIKSGWVFRVGAAGYAGLHIINGIVQDNLSFSESKVNLLTAAAVFLGGFFLQKMYKPTLRIGGKYHMEFFKL